MEIIYNRVLLTDDHPVTRAGLCRLLESDGFQVVAAAGSGEEALQHYRQLRPDLVLMDISMPGMGGLEAVRRIRDVDPAARVMVLSVHDSALMLAEAVAAGAAAYLTKRAEPALILEALRHVAAGRRYFESHLARRLALDGPAAGGMSPLQRLTARELQVFRLLVAGRSVREIAGDLAISDKTAGVHRSRIMQKLAIRSPVQLVRLAFHCGVLA